MRDPRNARLAQVIVHHSLRLQAGEAVLVESFDVAGELVLDLIEEVQRVRAIPVVALRSNAVHLSMSRDRCGSATRRSSSSSPSSSCSR